MELFIGESQSLKDKRRVLKSLKDRLTKQFNISLAEVGHSETWQRCELAVVTVSTNVRRANSVLSKAVNLVERDVRVELVDYEMERI